MSQPAPLTRILIAQPSHGPTVHADAADAFHRPVGPDSPLDYQLMRVRGSLLPHVFNRAWGMAGDAWEAGQIDGFAMIHSDIAAEAGWLDTLHEQLLATDADLISAVVPIKCREGLSSTAVDNHDDPWVVRRLTMAQAQTLPVTFTANDVGAPLLLNTGLWLCRLGPWIDKVCFRFFDCIRKEDGKRVARSQPEDWDFSRQCNALGLRIAATRAASLLHQGETGYSSEATGGWGWDQMHGDALANRPRVMPATSYDSVPTTVGTAPLGS